jgi:hypothetical protein
MADAGLIGEASIDWDHLDADDHENLEKLTARRDTPARAETAGRASGRIRQ